MRSHRFSFRSRDWLADKIKERARGSGSQDTSAYLRSQVLRDLLHSRTDEWIKQVANAKPTEREYLLKILFKLPTDLKPLIKFLAKCKF